MPLCTQSHSKTEFIFFKTEKTLKILLDAFFISLFLIKKNFHIKLKGTVFRKFQYELFINYKLNKM
jgi:hypothetical protein